MHWLPNEEFPASWGVVFSQVYSELGHMTQFLHWTVIVFKNMFSILLSMTNEPHHEVTMLKDHWGM